MPENRYLVRCKDDSRALTDFLAALDATIKLIDTIGPKGQPHTAVLEMQRETAAMLAQRFHRTNQLIIEPDRPLSLFR